MKFNVNDMSCDHCKKRIETALKDLEGVKKVKVDLKSKIVEVLGSVSPESAGEAIKEAGYTPVAV
jgi:copper chaperone CopZ